MAKDRSTFGSEFLRSEDLLVGGKYVEVRIPITGVWQPGELSDANDKPIPKVVIGFAGKSKTKLALCETSRKLLILLLGDQPGPSWIGKTVHLQVRECHDFGGGTVPAIRVVPPVGTKLKKDVKKHLGVPAVWTPPQTEKTS